MSTKNLIKEAVKEILLSEKSGGDARDYANEEPDPDDFQYDAIARKLIWTYEDGTVDQDISKLVDNYVKAYKSSHGVDLDGEKLYDAVVEQMSTFTDSTNVRSFGGGFSK